MASASAPPPRGVYTPVVAFFHEDESLDLDALVRHITRIVKSGAAGFVLQGSNGEAPHLSHDERTLVISTVRKTANDLGRPEMAIIAGCGAQSTRETVQLCKEAAQAGAGWALVLPPSYWSKFLSRTCVDICRHHHPRRRS